MDNSISKENNSNPLVSIIVITYNSSKFVLETLESAKAQTYQNIELIISDDSSKDDTVAICRKWLEENKDRFVHTELITVPENTGIPANCNRGVRATQGQWVKLIAGDDALTINCIEIYVEHVISNPEKLVLYSNVIHYMNYLEETFRQEIYMTGNLKISSAAISAKEQFEILLRVNKIWAGSLFISKKVYELVDFYDESLRFWEDRPLLLKITGKNIKLYFIDFLSCKYRINSASVQRSKISKALITPFRLEKELYYLNNYLKHLPNFERFIKTILIRRVLLIDRIGFNRNNIITRGFMYLSAFPWKIFEKQINKKYL